MVTLFTACDPVFTVVLTNTSSKQRQVKVIGDVNDSLFGKDFVVVTNSPDSIFSSTGDRRAVVRNRVEKSYTFTLGEGESSILEQGIGSPKLKERIVLDNIDTIVLKKSKRVSIKKGSMGGVVKITTE